MSPPSRTFLAFRIGRAAAFARGEQSFIAKISFDLRCICPPFPPRLCAQGAMCRTHGRQKSCDLDNASSPFPKLIPSGFDYARSFDSCDSCAIAPAPPLGIKLKVNRRRKRVGGNRSSAHWPSAIAIFPSRAPTDCNHTGAWPCSGRWLSGAATKWRRD